MHEQSAVTATSLGPPAGQATEFELIGRDPLEGASVETAFARNRAFAAAGGHEGATVFPALRLLVITCLDPRVDPAHVLGLDLGDAIVVRNGGGRVTPEVIENVAFVGQLAENAVPEGPLFEVAVIHHTQCGAGALADDDFRHRYARGSARTSPRCATTRSSTPRPRSRATSIASAPQTRSPTGSPSPATSTTSSPAWWKR